MRTSHRRLASDTAGASMPEYALIAGTILLAGFAAFKLLGKNNKQDAECGADLIAGNAANCTPGAAQPIAQANAPGPASGHGGPAAAADPGAGYCTRTGCTDGKHCFVAGTRVVTRDGLQPIESLRAGDEVLSADVETGVLVYRRVTATFETPDRPLVDVHVRGDREPIRATPGHPFYTDRGWVPAASLIPGDRLGELAEAPIEDSTLSIDGVVDSISATPDHATVYNLEVDGTHAYFVGAARVLVHNVGCLPFGSSSSSTTSEPGDGPAAANAAPALPPPVQGLINNPTSWLQQHPIYVAAPSQPAPNTNQPHQFQIGTTPTGWGNQYTFSSGANLPVGTTPTGEQFPAWVVHTTNNNDPQHIAVDVLPATGGPDIALTYSQSGCCVIMGQDTEGNAVAAHLHAQTPITALDGGASQGSGVTLTQVIQHQGALADGGTIQTIYGAGGYDGRLPGLPSQSYTLTQRPTLVWIRKNGQWAAYAQVKNINGNTITVKKVWPPRSCPHMPCVIM